MKQSVALSAATGVDPVRRGMVLAMAMAGAGLPACSGFPPGLSGARCDRPDWLYVGTDGRGLRAFAFDPCEGALSSAGMVLDVEKPRWTVAHPRLPVLYLAVDGSGAEGRMVACAVDGRSGALTLLNAVGAGGSGTTHLLLDAPGNTLFAANFGGGSVASASVRADGSLGERASLIQATGSGPHRRQASPHAHGVTLDPSGQFVLVADLGVDRVFVYGRGAGGHALLPDAASPPRAFAMAPGSGPRRVVFGVSGEVAYVLCELTAEILTLRWDAAQGRLAPVQSTALSSPGFQGNRSASEIALGSDGRFLYAADRGEATLLVYRVDPQTGLLALVQRIACAGELPWAFVIHPSGRWLVVANHRSNRLQVFQIDARTGLLALTGHTAESPAPVSLGFGPG